MVLHFAATADDISKPLVPDAVAAASGQRKLLKNRDVFALELAVPQQKSRRREAGESAADDVRALFVRARRFSRLGKGGIVSV